MQPLPGGVPQGMRPPYPHGPGQLGSGPPGAPPSFPVGLPGNGGYPPGVVPQSGPGPLPGQGGAPGSFSQGPFPPGGNLPGGPKGGPSQPTIFGGGLPPGPPGGPPHPAAGLPGPMAPGMMRPSGPPAPPPVPSSGTPINMPCAAPPSAHSGTLAGIPPQGPPSGPPSGPRPFPSNGPPTPPFGPPPGANGLATRPGPSGFPPSPMGGPPSSKGMAPPVGAPGFPGGTPPPAGFLGAQPPPAGFQGAPPPPGGFPAGPLPPGGGFPGGPHPPGSFPGGPSPPGGFSGGLPPPPMGFGGPPMPPGFRGPPGPPGPPGPFSDNPPGGMVPPRQPGKSERIDPTQIPRPSANSLGGHQNGGGPIVFDTRLAGAHNYPPPAASRFVVRDRGSCGPRYMRSTLNQVPFSNDLLTNTGMPLGVVVSPLTLPDPDDETIQVVDLGELGPVRCARCKAYMNAYMRFSNSGRNFTCNFCNHSNTTPDAYFCHMGPDGRRGDADERPELCKGSVEYIAPVGYSVRPPMPPAHFFVIDVSQSAVQQGTTATLCAALSQVLQGLEDERLLVGLATYDQAIHFYSLRSVSASPQMLVVSDIQEVFAPASAPLLVPLVQYKEQLTSLLDSIPAMFAQGRLGDNCAGAAVAAAVEVMAPTGGKVHAFIGTLPQAGLHALKPFAHRPKPVGGSPRRDRLSLVFTPPATPSRLQPRDTGVIGEKDKLNFLVTQDQGLRELAVKAADCQVCVDVSFVSNSYIDVATFADLASRTGGTVYSYAPFNPALDFEQLLNDLRWNITRIQGMEAVMRVRCSQGLEVESYLGAFYKRPNNVTDVDLPGIDCDKAILARIQHLEKLPVNSEAFFQCALLYTTTAGHRRIRVHTLAVPVSDSCATVFKGADLDAQITFIGRQLAAQLPGSTLSSGREFVTKKTLDILHAYRKYCAASSSAVQLILPEALKLLPLYALALLKSTGLRDAVKPDERALWVAQMMSLTPARIGPLLYPRLIPVHKLLVEDACTIEQVMDGQLASSEVLEIGGVYLLENGMDAHLFFDKAVDPAILNDLLGVSSLDDLGRVPGTAVMLIARDTRASQIVQNLLVKVRTHRCSFLRLRVSRRGDPSEVAFFTNLVEDRSAAGMSYVEYLCQVHRLIQNRMGSA